MQMIRWLFSVILLALSLTSIAFCDTKDDKLPKIKNAIIKSLCYDIYWGNVDFYKREASLVLKIQIDKDKFYAKVEDIGLLGRKMIFLYEIGLLRSDAAVVTHNFEMNIEKRFESKQVIFDSLLIPSDCEPHYESSTSRKELMILTIIKTVKKNIADFIRNGIANYPRKLTFIIADFNVDYPSTFILIEETKDLFKVQFHDPQNYYSSEYEQLGEYPFGEVYAKDQGLIDKIRKHNITREVDLGTE